jgi:hypothetical protein
MASSQQQRLEPRLLEMPVGSQSIGEAVLLHHDERYAIGERPLFVRPTGE